MIAAPSIRLVAMPENRAPDGETRVALVVTPPPTSINRRPVLRVFGSIAAAIAAKRSIEESR
jgi:hypothetical protein